MSFENLGLSPALLSALNAKGYSSPTPVQTRAIPAAMDGKDLLVSSKTGSGKTAAFLLPGLARLAQPPRAPGKGPRVLVLSPTRELAQQVQRAAEAYGKSLLRLRTVALVGGAPYHEQLRALSRPVDLVVATPGRLIDHIERGRIDLARIELLVLDEADRMLDMGFVDDIDAIVARLPKERQTLLFSATLDGVVGRVAQRVTRDAERIDVASPKEESGNIDQRVLLADDFSHKMRLLGALLGDASLDQALVFTGTKIAADELAQRLRDSGLSADALHGDMNQGHRNRTLRRLHMRHTRVLVATDVAARGIDVPGISHVINFDLPKQAEDYVHRIGRTGRAGRSGTAITLATHAERHRVRAIERFTAQPIPFASIPGLEPRARPAPSAERRGAPGRDYGRPGRRSGPAKASWR